MDVVSDFLSKLHTITFCLICIFIVEVSLFNQSLSHFTWRRFRRRATSAAASTTLLGLIDAQSPAIRYYDNGSGDELKECAVCLMKLEDGDEMRVLQCNHDFHKECLDQWLEKEQLTCPLCRRHVLPEKVVFEHKQLRSEVEFAREGAHLAYFMLYGIHGRALH
ncbi:E3 ubiquitin-protein ligase RNF13-like [Macadamia integrifolia]|uniref:E3 ubiquitin-protein ligase RNF13-like n=1 Tax=Macadamia integrifolia TaxID=60698 RepID=UPI001C5326E4|nr:E3 ubiquitin-protein ligase RNF13-like [Macadamia integrifolia]